MRKSLEDVLGVISLGKEQEIVDFFLNDYLHGLAEDGMPDQQILEEAKRLKLIDISVRFRVAMLNGVCQLSLGWPIDCRRGGEDDDIANMDGALRLAAVAGLQDGDQITAPGICGADDEFYMVTVAQLRDVVIPEMLSYCNGLFNRKWAARNSVQGASSVDAVLQAHF